MKTFARSNHIPLSTMGMPSLTTSSTGTSSSYAATQARFQEILTSKLGIQVTPTLALGADGLPLASSDQASSTSGSRGIMTSQALTSLAQDVRVGSGDSMNAIDQTLAGTPMEGLGAAFKAAENTYGVNAYFLSALAAHESDFGKSSIATDKNNLFGFMAYDSSPYTSAKSYSSVEEGIFEVAQFLSNQYLKPGASHFNGYSIDAIGQDYATDPEWANKVKSHLQNFISK